MGHPATGEIPRPRQPLTHHARSVMVGRVPITHDFAVGISVSPSATHQSPSLALDIKFIQRSLC